MELERVYRYIRFFGIGIIFLSFSWAILKSSIPFESRPSFKKAVEFYTDGKFHEALLNYESAILEDPDFIHARRGRARSLMQLGRDKEALKAFDEVLKLDTNSAVSFANRAILEDRMGLYEMAIIDYRKAIKMDPNLGEGIDWFTRLLQSRKEDAQNLSERLEFLRDKIKEEKKIIPLKN